MDMQTSFLDRLFEEGLLIETGVDGLYGRSGQFEDVIAAFERLIDRTGGADGAEAIRFPPGINRAYFEKSGYMKSFPQLAGTVHSFCGCELDHVSLLKSMDEVATGPGPESHRHRVDAGGLLPAISDDRQTWCPSRRRRSL